MRKMKNIILGTIALFATIIFVQNAIFTGDSIFGVVDFKLFLWSQKVPIVILMFISLFIGYLIGFIHMYFKNKYTPKKEEIVVAKDDKE